MVTTIISDMGGVYLNRGIWLFWDYLNEKYGIPVEKAKLVFLKNYKQFFSGFITEEVFWANLLTEISLKEDWKELRKTLLDFFEVNPEISDFYKKSRAKGFKLVLLADQAKEWWPELDKKLNISSNFDFVVISALVGLHKPNPDIYLHALKISKSTPEESVFIDDIDYNLTPAKDLGMKTILFENSQHAISEFELLGINRQ